MVLHNGNQSLVSKTPRCPPMDRHQSQSVWTFKQYQQGNFKNTIVTIIVKIKKKIIIIIIIKLYLSIRTKSNTLQF